jgi:hypothetical protein
LNCRIFELPKPPEANEPLNPEPWNPADQYNFLREKPFPITLNVLPVIKKASASMVNTASSSRLSW